MKVITAICLLLVSVTVAAQENNPPKMIIEKNGKMTNIRVEGSLASKTDIGCIPITKASSKLTPPDLYRGVITCIDIGKYKEAAELFGLAGMYGNFDAARVTDKTAGQAKTVLIMNAFSGLSDEKKKKFQTTLIELLGKDRTKLRALCSNISSIGYPTYYPEYMILHGIKAFTGDPNNGAISENFEAESTWKKLFEAYLHCPQTQ